MKIVVTPPPKLLGATFPALTQPVFLRPGGGGSNLRGTAGRFPSPPSPVHDPQA